MGSIRRLLARRHLAMLVCAAALLLKLLVPAGTMISFESGRIALTACPGVIAQVAAMDMAAAHGDMADHRRAPEHGKAEMPCAFASLSAATLAAIDPVLLVAFIAFIVALGLRGSAIPAPAAFPFLHPPSRGPPATL